MTVPESKKLEISYSSNPVRLTVKQWLLVAALSIVTIVSVPVFWKHLENFTPDEDYRLPYQLSNDYWQFQRFCGLACERYDTVILGDSVVWGHYVPKTQTLSHYLNELTGSVKYANLGVDGMHPAALEGLLRYYGSDIKNKNVILHLNLLWMSSPMVDLQIDKEFHFNHPKLVSQFFTEIPCYKASFSARIGIVLERHITFANWTSHLNITYFQNLNIPAWTIENPYKNPISAINFKLPEEDTYQKNPELRAAGNDSQAPNTGGEFQWVEAQTSLQWKFFRNSIKLLQEKGNKIFVLVGPFNESAIGEPTGEGMKNYLKLKSDIEIWLKQNNIAYLAPASLPAELYNDASHPTAQGYKTLADELLKSGKID